MSKTAYKHRGNLLPEVLQPVLNKAPPTGCLEPPPPGRPGKAIIRASAPTWPHFVWSDAAKFAPVKAVGSSSYRQPNICILRVLAYFWTDPRGNDENSGSVGNSLPLSAQRVRSSAGPRGYCVFIYFLVCDKISMLFTAGPPASSGDEIRNL